MLEEFKIAFPVLWPAALFTGLLMLAAWWPWGRRAKAGAIARHSHGFSALALGGGFVTGLLVLMRGWPGVPPPERWQWILPMAGVAMIFGVIAGALRPRFGLGALIAAVLAIITAALLHPPPKYEAVLIWRAVLAAAVLAMWLALEPLAARRPGPVLPLAWLIVIAGASLALKESAFAMLSLGAASLSAAMGTVLIIALLNNRLSLAMGATHVLAAVVPAIVLIGIFYLPGNMPATSLILIGAAPLALWLGEIWRPSAWRQWAAGLLRVALVAAPVIIAVMLAKARAE